MVVNETMKILTPENIDKIARSVENSCAKERNTANLKRLNRLIKENEIAMVNLIKALESGKIVEVIASQIEKRQMEKVELEAQLAKEKMQKPLLTYKEIKFFLSGLQMAMLMT